MHFSFNIMSLSLQLTFCFRRYVITAAHCHDRTDPRYQISEVVLGDYDLSKDPDCFSTCKLAQRFDIRPRDVISHEDYDISKVSEF